MKRLTAIAWCCIALAFNAHASNNQPTLSDFGGAGLLQTPTARMFDAGEVAFSISYVEPYRRGNLTFQPVDWLEANIRYTDVGNREYDPNGVFSTQSYKDKGIDFKLGLLNEDFYIPELALGFRDVGGTGMFASEYLVASKRFADVDISLGLAWGYMGSRGDIGNPFSMVLGDQYDDRIGRQGDNPGGDTNFKSFFRGSPSFFGGIEYQTPWQPLVLKLEYEGNNYQYEPQNNIQEQNSALNLGAVFHINDFISFHTGLERGNKALLGLTLNANFGKARPTPKLSDPKPVALKEPSAINHTATNWKKVSQSLKKNAGYSVREIAIRHKEVVMRGEQEKFFAHAQGIGRSARILNNNIDKDIEWITVIDEKRGITLKETSIPRDLFLQVNDHDADTESLRRHLSESPVSQQEQTSLYLNDNPDPFTYGFGLGYKQNLGGPDKFILYQFSADAGAQYYFQPNLWWSAGLSLALLDNFDQFNYDGPSLLPRVRTDLRHYLTSSDIMMPSFQLSYTKKLGDDVYALVYAGMLEYMYGGYGGEILYRPFGERVALGLDLNQVRQRGYEQDFSFRDYETVTGHLTSYWDTGYSDILVATSFGRYLAKDWGVTLDISRTFKNGVMMGGFITRTDVSKEEFGEGSYNKGIYISVPFDLMLTSSTLRRATLAWTPLTRDGGAKLGRKHSLYNITDGLNLQHFHDRFEQIND